MLAIILLKQPLKLRNKTQHCQSFCWVTRSLTQPTILYRYFLTIETVLAGLHSPYIELMADQY